MDARGGQDEDQGKKGNQDKEGNDEEDNADNAKYGGGVSSIGECLTNLTVTVSTLPPTPHTYRLEHHHPIVRRC